MTLRIGVLIGSERALSHSLLERLGAEPGVHGELVVVGGTPDGQVCPYDAIIDRISHRVPCYRSYLKSAALAGCAVLSDPFALDAEDKFFALSLAKRLGLKVPPTLLLPQHRYPGVAEDQSLRNLQYPLDWNAIGGYVGYPARLRSVAHGHRFSHRVESLEELWSAFEQTGERVVMLQHEIAGPRVEVLCVGGEHTLVRGEPPPDLVDAARAIAVQLSRTLGYELSSVELAIAASGIWVLDAGEPYPELDPAALGSSFDRVVGWLAARAAAAGRSRTRIPERYRWSEVLS